MDFESQKGAFSKMKSAAKQLKADAYRKKLAAPEGSPEEELAETPEEEAAEPVAAVEADPVAVEVVADVAPDLQDGLAPSNQDKTLSMLDGEKLEQLVADLRKGREAAVKLDFAIGPKG